MHAGMLDSRSCLEKCKRPGSVLRVSGSASTRDWRFFLHLIHTTVMKFIQNCVTETVKCSETVRSSNLQLSFAHNRRTRKTERVYLTPFPRTKFAWSWLFLRSCRQYTSENVYVNDMWLHRCGDHIWLLLTHSQQYSAVLVVKSLQHSC